MARISVDDLTVGQIEDIEQDLNLPMSAWRNPPSYMALLVAIASAATGRDKAEFRAMKPKALTDLVDALGADDETTDPNPSPATVPST